MHPFDHLRTAFALGFLTRQVAITVSNEMLDSGETFEEIMDRLGLWQAGGRYTRSAWLEVKKVR